MLNKAQKQFLRGKANPLKPTVTVGKSGVTPAVIASLDQALTAHELVKVSVLGSCPVSLTELSILLAARSHSELVSQLGRRMVFYRRNPEGPVIPLP
jgi:RNA-binding protein